jgi:hypothetical protein
MQVQITLPGSRVSDQPLRMCDQHKELVIPENGVTMSPNKWVCAKCWFSIFMRGRK